MLNVTVTSNHGRADGMLIAGEVLDSTSGELVEQVGLEIGRPAYVDVEPGSYTVRARLPSGRIVTVQTEGRTDVRIPIPPSAHEWMEYQTATGAIPAADHYRSSGRSTADEPWVQLWTTRPVSWPPTQLETDGTAWALTFGSPQPSHMQYVLCGASKAPWRVTVLPVEATPHLTIRTEGPGTGEAGDIDLSVNTESSAGGWDPGELRRAESVLLALHRGRVETATLIAAQRLLFEKLADPTGAAIGGYYLLMAGDFERMHNWPGNFENWKDYLPDAAIIHGLQLLWKPDTTERDLQAGSHSLIRASLLGPPMFTVGLRLLRQGLENLRRHVEDPSLDGALRLVNAYADAADLDKPYTTYLARSPFEPVTRPITGVPIDRTHLHWLSSLRTGAWPFPGDDESIPAGARRQNVFVEPTAQSEWRVTSAKEGRQRFRTKREAVAFARRTTSTSLPGRLVVYRADGSTERVMTFH